MPRRIADTNRPRTAVDRSRIQALDRLRIAPARIFRHVHDVEPERNRILNGLLRRLQQKVVGPPFRESSNRARSNKGRSLDWEAGLLHDLGNWANVVLMSPRRAVGANPHLVRGDLPR